MWIFGFNRSGFQAAKGETANVALANVLTAKAGQCAMPPQRGKWRGSKWLADSAPGDNSVLDSSDKTDNGRAARSFFLWSPLSGSKRRGVAVNKVVQLNCHQALCCFVD
jgi:hypothetical protein